MAAESYYRKQSLGQGNIFTGVCGPIFIIFMPNRLAPNLGNPASVTVEVSVN